MNSTLICKCDGCGGEIEFLASQAGDTALCPHCKFQTPLVIPRNVSRSVQQPAQPSIAPRPPKQGNQRISGIAIIAFTGVGALVIFSGFAVQTESAIHQIYRQLVFLNGLACIGLACLIAIVTKKD